jgi:hypothetical protein
MKLNEILSDSFNAAEWEAKGYELPKYDIAAVAKKTHNEPTWVHFGAGNIFHAIPITSSILSPQLLPPSFRTRHSIRSIKRKKIKKVWLFELFFVLLQPITHFANKTGFFKRKERK